MKRSKTTCLLLAGCALVALALGTCTGSMFAGLKRLAAPLVCAGGTVDSMVAYNHWHPEDGATSWESYLYCQDGEGTRTRMPYWKVALALAGYAFAGLVLALVLVGRLARPGAPEGRSRRGGGWLVVALVVLSAGSILVIFLSPIGTVDESDFVARGGEYLSGRGPRLLEQQVKAALGRDPKFSQLSISGVDATLVVQNQKNPRYLDAYTLRYGDLSDPAPVKDPRPEEFLNLFGFGDIELDSLPELVRRCLAQVDGPPNSLVVAVSQENGRMTGTVICPTERQSMHLKFDGQKKPETSPPPAEQP
jgi:hypothetical protein